MANTPQERRRESAERDVPPRDGAGQMGQQKSSGGDTREPRESRVHTEAGRDAKPDQPADDGGRVPPGGG
jgi:hypothetical protein